MPAGTAPAHLPAVAQVLLAGLGRRPVEVAHAGVAVARPEEMGSFLVMVGASVDATASSGAAAAPVEASLSRLLRHGIPKHGRLLVTRAQYRT